MIRKRLIYTGKTTVRYTNNREYELCINDFRSWFGSFIGICKVDGSDPKKYKNLNELYENWQEISCQKPHVRVQKGGTQLIFELPPDLHQETLSHCSNLLIVPFGELDKMNKGNNSINLGIDYAEND